jgi:hypothetical protein
MNWFWPIRFTQNWGLIFLHIGAVLQGKGNTPHNYETFRCSPSSHPRSRDPTPPALPLPAIPIRQLAKQRGRNLAPRQAGGSRVEGPGHRRIRVFDLPPPLPSAGAEVLRSASRQLRAGLHARRPLRPVAVLPLTPQNHASLALAPHLSITSYPMRCSPHSASRGEWQAGSAIVIRLEKEASYVALQ